MRSVAVKRKYSEAHHYPDDVLLSRQGQIHDEKLVTGQHFNGYYSGCTDDLLDLKDGKTGRSHCRLQMQFVAPFMVAISVQHLLHGVDPMWAVHLDQVVLKDLHIIFMLEGKNLLPALLDEHRQTFGTGN